MDAATLNKHVTDISALMSQRLRVHGRTFEAQVRKAGRALPKARAREARYLVHAQTLSQNPKLIRMIDHAQVQRASVNLTDFLNTVDPNARRKDRVLAVLGVLAANVLLIGGAVITYLWWQGIV